MYHFNECTLILSSITQKGCEKIKIPELLIRPAYNKNVMATFNVPWYVQVYKRTTYVRLARWNEYKYFIFQIRASYKNKFKLQKNIC